LTRLTLQTVPHALCTLRLEGSPNPELPLRVYADADGIVLLHVCPDGHGNGVARFFIDCESGGSTTRQAIELRASFEPTADMPAPPDFARPAPREGAITRPALSEDEMLRLGPEELFARGFPPRPDPDAHPRAFRSWHRMVCTPAIHVKPHLAPRPEFLHVPPMPSADLATTLNWSGFELRGLPAVPPLHPTQRFALVRGSWTVPYCIGNIPQRTYSTVWVGIDGDGLKDLVQAGTETDTSTVAANNREAAQAPVR